MSVGRSQPVEGAAPPSVFNRWMNVVFVNVTPPVGPAWNPVCSTSILSQGIAPALTKFASTEDSITLPHTVLVSRESCHATRPMPFSRWVGAEEMGDELFIPIVEQRGLRRKQHPVDAPERIYGLAFVVLCAEAATKEERLVRRHLDVGGHRWRRDTCACAACGNASVRAMPRVVT